MKKTAQLSALGREIQTFKDGALISWDGIAKLSGVSGQVVCNVIRKTYERTKVWNLQKNLQIPEWKFACLMFGVQIPEDTMDIIPLLKKLGFIVSGKNEKLTFGELMHVLLHSREADPASLLAKIKEIKKEKALAKLSSEEREILGLKDFSVKK